VIRRNPKRRLATSRFAAGIPDPERLISNLYSSYWVASITTVLYEGRVTAMAERLGRGAAFSMAVIGGAGPMYAPAVEALGNRPAMYRGSGESYGLGSIDSSAPLTNGSATHGVYVVGSHVSQNATKAIIGAQDVDSYLGSTPANHGIAYTNGRAAQDNIAMSDEGFAMFVDMDANNVAVYIHYASGATRSWATTGGPPSIWLGLTMMVRSGNANPWFGALAECGFTSGPLAAGERDALITQRLKPLYGFT